MTLPSVVGGPDGDPRRTIHAPADWVDEAPASDGGLRMYFDVLRGRLPILILAAVSALATAFIFVSRAEKVYEADAGVLVTPVPRTNTDLFGLGLVSESGDPTRDAETLAQFITTPAVANRVRRTLRTRDSSNELLENVEALPVAQSSIVAITARANDPEEAAQIANAFGEAAIAVRTDRMHVALDQVIPRLKTQLAGIPTVEAAARQTLSERIRTLEALRLQSDPTLHLETQAAPPPSAVAPRPVLSLAAALMGGLILGVALVLGVHVFDTRIEREQDLRRYRIPIVGRIPREPFLRRIRKRGLLTPSALSRRGLDAYRQLASQLFFGADRPDSTIFVTSAGPRDGKTTTSVNVSSALARLGEPVVLADADSRRPALGRFLPETPDFGLRDVAAGHASAGDAVVTATDLSGVQILAQVAAEDGALARPLDADGADTLIREVKRRAQWLVFDGPALAYAPEVLPLAMSSSTVLIVVRLRATRARDLAGLADLLVQQRITPAGFVVIGADPRPVY